MTNRVPAEITCRALVEIVTDYLEDALPLEERTRVEQHLLYCRGCAVYLEQLRQQTAAAGRLREEEIAPPVREALLRAFRGFKKVPT